MTIRSAMLATGAAAAILASPAAAQGYQYEIGAYEDAASHRDAGTYDGEWQGEWEDEDTWRGIWHGSYTDFAGETVDAQYRGTFHGETQFVSEDGHVLLHDENSGWREGEGHYAQHSGRDHGSDHHDGYGRRDLGAAPDGRLGYSLAEREAWLADCRVLMSRGDGYYYSDHRGRRGDGRVAGGLLGAVAGGIIGNRVASGERLAGTLIGAGVGGIAGIAIGAAIDAASRRHERDEAYAVYEEDEIYAAQYCDAYLRRYEAGGHGGYYGQVAYAQPVMLVRASAYGGRGHRHGPECETVVTEEWVDVPAAAPPSRARRTIPRPAPQPEPGKITPID